LSTHDLLIEIGVEEIPAEHLGPALEYIRTSFEAMLRAAGLDRAGLSSGCTPRRFYLIATGLPEMQADSVAEKTGPAVKIAYDAAGGLTPAAQGFLRKNNASAEDLQTQTTDKGEFLLLRTVQKGRPTLDIVSDWFGSLPEQIPFPKKMIWDRKDFAFSRPLRWICALWDNEVLNIGFGNLQSGRLTYGNRYLGLDRPVEVDRVAGYLGVLRQNGVLADRDERRAVIVKELAGVIRDSGYSVVPDERLTDTVCDLVEMPHAVEASFPEEYLLLPEKIITSTISQNQKYFSVTAPDGKLSNRFAFISNGDPAYDALIRHGNEKVVRSRLADAMWYFKEDCRKPLDSYVPQLRDVVFQSRLGTLEDKRVRVENLCAYMCEALRLSETETEAVLRCARLAKADLVTTMLGEKEFTKLQGYIGMHYALASGEESAVARGIYEHYMPRGSNDALPETLCGSVVAVADKLDTVCGIIGVGMLPTGSADPFALRRAANGVVQILAARDWHLAVEPLLERAIAGIALQVDMAADAPDQITGFVSQRMVWLLRQEGFEYDVVESVMQAGSGSMGDLIRRCAAMALAKQSPRFISLVIGFKRASNIIQDDSVIPALDTALFTLPAENALHNALQALRVDIDSALASRDHDLALNVLTDFGVHVDAFFEQVLVNCEDDAIRMNRHALLAEVRAQFLRIADISRIIVDTDNGA